MTGTGLSVMLSVLPTTVTSFLLEDAFPDPGGTAARGLRALSGPESATFAHRIPCCAINWDVSEDPS